MRSLLHFFCFASLILGAPSLHAQKTRPQFRPAVLATGHDSLVNRIDVKSLLSKGQKDGAVQFGATISADGQAGEVWTYHAMPGSQELEKEVLKALTDAKFTPPIYNHQPITAVLCGTVVFDADIPPHLRIFLNQDPKEIAAGSDFIAPQPVVGADSNFKGLNVPKGIPVALDGIVEIEIKVDLKGNLQELNVTGENPPMLGFREAALSDFDGAKFIPAFRLGDPTESTCVVSVCYKPVGVAPETEESSSEIQLQVKPGEQPK